MKCPFCGRDVASDVEICYCGKDIQQYNNRLRSPRALARHAGQLRPLGEGELCTMTTKT